MVAAGGEVTILDHGFFDTVPVWGRGHADELLGWFADSSSPYASLFLRGRDQLVPVPDATSFETPGTCRGSPEGPGRIRLSGEGFEAAPRLREIVRRGVGEPVFLQPMAEGAVVDAQQPGSLFLDATGFGQGA